MDSSRGNKPMLPISLTVGKNQGGNRALPLGTKKFPGGVPKLPVVSPLQQRPFSQREGEKHSSALALATKPPEAGSRLHQSESEPVVGDRCSICRKTFDWSGVAQINCGHFACLDCIKSYLLK